MTPGRPAPVVAHVRRPLLWLIVLAGVLALATAVAAVDSEQDDRRRDRSIDVSGTLLDRETADGFARVRYVHPVTEQEVTISIPVWDRGRLPPREGPIALDADPDDPDGVRVDGDVYPATGELGWDLPFLAIPVVVWGRRRWSLARTERLMAGTGPTFAMLAAIAPTGWLGRRTELHLWPLDAAPGAPSLCRVGLLATGHLPIGGSVFTVEVKGLPRAFGRLAARSPDTGGVLWPVGAGLPHGTRPRPAATIVPARLPPEVPPPPTAERVRLPRAGLALGFSVAVLGLLLLGSVATLVVRGTREVRHFARGERVVAEVTARTDGTTGRLALAYTRAGEQRTGRAEVTYAEDFPVGRRYPAHVDPDDPSRLLLAKSRYDPIGPLVWGSLPLVASLVLLGVVLRQWRMGRRLARRGPWRPFEMWTGTESEAWATLVTPRTGQALCSATFGPSWLTDLPTAPPVTAAVAGDPQPRGRIVVHFDGSTRVVAATGAARRLCWWKPAA